MRFSVLSAIVLSVLAAAAAQGQARPGYPIPAPAAPAPASAPQPPAPYDGWRTSAFNKTELFTAWSEEGRVGVRSLPTSDGGAIIKALDIPLTEDTQIAFDWRYDSLPALGDETEGRFHDYVSIALVFDNGQDLTWLHTAHAPLGSFHCPLQGWTDRETHFVLETGPEGLGKWRSHRRKVADDYRAAIEGELPKRITAVWIINVGLFGGHEGSATFANVAVTSGGKETRVFESP